MRYCKMKLPLSLIVFCFFCCIVGNAQSGTGTVNVRFVDEQQKPIDGLLVQLMKPSDSSLVLSSFSGTDGHVQFINVRKGNYFIYVAQFGYEAYKSASFKVDESHLSISFPDIILHTKVLKEVTVVAQVPFVEKQPDMMVVNVDKSPMSAGSSTMEVLERSPGVIIDQNDNINLQGKSGVSIMIDGKKTAMSGSELADFLRALPADAIEKIELITDPGAKYDAAGTGGIINIVMKKGKLLGLNATAMISYGQGIYPKEYGGFTLNDRTEKFNFFLDYNYSYRKNLKDVNMDQDFYNGQQLIESTQQHSYYNIPNYINVLHGGIDFFVSDKTTIGFTVDGNTRKYQYNESSHSSIDSIGLPFSYSNSIASDNGTESQYSVELSYKHKYDSSGKKMLSIITSYTNFVFSDIQQFANNYTTSENQYFQPPLLYGHVPFYNQAYIFQADYSTPLKNRAKLEAGAKTSYVNIDANTQFFLGADNSSPVDTAQTEHYKYKENIIAGYFTYSKSMKGSNLSLGLRAEQTFATGSLVTTGQTINRNYLYWFPHITYTDTLNQLNNLEVSTGTRFNRPGYDELNPFKNYINPTTYNQGNPILVPEYEYDINVSDVFKSIYVFTLSYSGTKQPEEQVHIPAPGEPGVTLITNENLQWKNYYGFNISATPQIKKWWTSNNYVAVYYNQYIADVSQTPINTGKLIFQGNSDNNLSLGEKVSLEINGQYSSGGFWGYFQSSPRWAIGSGIQAKCMKDKCTIKLSMTDIFYTNYFNTTSSVYNYNESYIVKRDSRVYGIAITYRFGKNYLPENDKAKKPDSNQDNAIKGL
jgi:hypothetical protein